MSESKKSTASADTRPAPVISVIGTGYLGATHAAAMAEMGFETIGVDIDPSKLAALSAGEVPFFEPGLPELITKHVASGKLRFTSDIASAVAAADVHFVCVGTPQKAGSHAANLAYVESATPGHRPRVHPRRHRRGTHLEPRVPARGQGRRGHPAPGPPGLGRRVRGRRRRDP
jgi:UDPglucose 6-dehydrogenase